MHPGESLTLGTVWLAISLYVAAEVARAIRPRGETVRLARWLNTLGVVTFLAHVASAFQFHHGWSHAAAYDDTARQTAARFGVNWGGGLFVNYTFALVWLGEVVWSWTDPLNQEHRPRWLTWTVRGVFLFMIFNGAVVFITGGRRWLGVGLCLLLVWTWWSRRKSTADLPGSSPSS